SASGSPSALCGRTSRARWAATRLAVSDGFCLTGAQVEPSAGYAISPVPVGRSGLRSPDVVGGVALGELPQLPLGRALGVGQGEGPVVVDRGVAPVLVDVPLVGVLGQREVEGQADQQQAGAPEGEEEG